MKVGLISEFLPKNTSFAMHSSKLADNLKADVVKITMPGCKGKYVINLKSFFLKKKLKVIIRKEKLDLLHFNYIAPFFGKYTLNLNFLSALTLNIPIVVSLNEVHYPGSSFKELVLNFIQKKVVKSASVVGVFSVHHKKYLERRYNAKNIECVYHGIDLEKYKEHKKGKNLLFFGLLTPNKGVIDLIRAMKFLEDYKLEIIGSIPNDIGLGFKDELLNEIKKNNLKNVKVKFGWVDEKDKGKYYNKADIVVLPYRWGPYTSGTLPEAISFGLPVVVTKVGSVWHYADIFKAGEIVKANNPKAIAEGVKKVYSNYRKYKEGIRRYRKIASWKAVGMGYSKVYKKALHKEKI